MNEQIFRMPEVRAFLCAWWDESQSFQRGVTSAVFADMLEERGWEEPTGANPLLPWMRGEFDAAATGYDFDPFLPAFHVGAATAVNQIVRRMVWPLSVGTKLRANAHVFGAMALTNEVREMLRLTSIYPNEINYVGMPIRLYGMNLVLDNAVPNGYIYAVHGDVKTVLRVYA